jgi:hypothetical protein
MTTFETIRVAAVQATPVILDAEGSVEKAVRLIGEAAKDRARLVVLPETFVPLYPSNAWANGASRFGGWDELWERLWANAVEVDGPLVEKLVRLGKQGAMKLAQEERIAACHPVTAVRERLRGRGAEALARDRQRRRRTQRRDGHRARPDLPHQLSERRRPRLRVL